MKPKRQSRPHSTQSSDPRDLPPKPGRRPLYSSRAEPEARPVDAHAGLWFDKFCAQWCRDPKKSGLSDWTLAAFSTGHGKQRKDLNPKLEWINTVTNAPVGNAQLLAEYTARLADLAQALGGKAPIFKTTSRFATGLGREHPIENGFVWHPVLGVPYLPGSSVKGLVRAWATTWAEPKPDLAACQRIFGAQNTVGTVLFLDALPVAPTQLKADVMTPHYGDYYQGKSPPADWLSPTPIPFLTVAPGQFFQFALAPATPVAQADCETALQWLTAALEWLGAGAKTAVGYGRFSPADGIGESGEHPARSFQGRSSSTILGQRYKAGQRVAVRRVEDPKGKGRIWFQADDGFGGVVTGGPPPQVEMDQTTELEIASVIQGTGYNFRLPRATPPSSHTETPRPRQ